MAQDRKVRFVRIRGRIVPIRSKRKALRNTTSALIGVSSTGILAAKVAEKKVKSKFFKALTLGQREVASSTSSRLKTFSPRAIRLKALAEQLQRRGKKFRAFGRVSKAGLVLGGIGLAASIFTKPKRKR